MSNLVVPKVRIGEIRQIGIVVRDLQKAADNYWATLGIGPWRIDSVRDLKVTVRGKPAAISVKLALAQCGTMQLELMEPLEGPSIYREFLDQRGEGLHHVQSRVEDIDGVLSAFKEMGIGVLMSGRVGENECYYMDSEPLLGIIYEFIKRVGSQAK